jgi:hypothetical protein
MDLRYLGALNIYWTVGTLEEFHFTQASDLQNLRGWIRRVGPWFAGLSCAGVPGQACKREKKKREPQLVCLGAEAPPTTALQAGKVCGRPGKNTVLKYAMFRAMRRRGNLS